MNKFNNKMVEFESNVQEEVNGLVRWVKGFVADAGVGGCILGMSGGIDCSCVAALLHKAEIPVLLVKMPYGQSMDFAKDRDDADELIEKFGFDSCTVDITKSVDMLESQLGELSEMARVNVKPRVRMTTLYAMAQTKGLLVIGTGNLSEIQMGYSTKWGDAACDFNPLAEYTKSEVRVLASYLGVPNRIIDKAPSANLWQGQTDEDEMGVTYYDLDRYILTGEGDDAVKGVVDNARRKSEHKRNSIPVYNRDMSF